jgi:cyanophycinase
VRRWFDLAQAHYDALGAEVLEVDVRDRRDATELRHVADVQEVGLVYLSGGKPDHLARTLEGTPLLDAILEQWRVGAALAGCSAGAMALAAAWPPFLPFSRSWGTGLGVLPDLAVVPHFDMVRRMTMGAVGRLGRRVPDGLRLLGIDEDTALVHTEGWAVEGAGGAWELDHDGVQAVAADGLPRPD